MNSKAVGSGIGIAMLVMTGVFYLMSLWQHRPAEARAGEPSPWVVTDRPAKVDPLAEKVAKNTEAIAALDAKLDRIIAQLDNRAEDDPFKGIPDTASPPKAKLKTKACTCSSQCVCGCQQGYPCQCAARYGAGMELHSYYPPQQMSFGGGCSEGR